MRNTLPPRPYKAGLGGLPMGGAGVLGALTFLAFPLGVIIAWLGFRVRRVGVGKRCRACEYELDSIAAGVDRCPECGSSLKSADSVVAGVARRRPWLSVVGLAIAIGGVPGFVQWVTPRLWSVQPTWLLREMVAADGALTSQAMRELLARQARLELSTGAGRKVCDRLLELRASSPASWREDYGSFFIVEAGRGSLAPEQIRAFYNGGITFSASARPKVRSGSDVAAWVQLRSGGITGNGVIPGLRIAVEMKGVVLVLTREGAEPIRLESVDGLPEFVGVGGLNSGGACRIPVRAAPGNYSARLEISVAVRAPDVAERIAFEPAIELGLMTVVPSDERVVAVLTGAESPDLAPRMRGALRLERCALDRGVLDVRIEQVGLPVPLVGILCAEYEDAEGKKVRREFDVINAMAQVGDSLPRVHEFRRPLPAGFQRGRLRFVVVPDLDRAEFNPGTTSAWGSEIDLGETTVP
ncbi:MAG: hypothetical protein ACOYN0_11790 [Phycisphaerales bacterium]